MNEPSDLIDLRCEGTVELTITDKNGVVKDRRVVHNRIVDFGLEMIASLITGQPNDPDFISGPTYCAIGSENTAVSPSDVRLHGHLIRKRFDTVERKDNNVTFTTTFLPAEPNYKNVRVGEVGLYNADVNGVMMNRAVFATMHKYIDDTLTIRWTITINAQPSDYDTVFADETPPPTGP